jgi:hypothetical protein
MHGTAMKILKKKLKYVAFHMSGFGGPGGEITLFVLFVGRT